jgi:hypothetical protein
MSWKIIIAGVCYGVFLWYMFVFFNRRRKRKHKGYITGIRKKNISFKFLFADMNKLVKEMNNHFLWMKSSRLF